MVRDSLWALVNVAVCSVSIGYGEGLFLSNGEYGGNICISVLCTGTVVGHR
jgi:hypothetical protein